MFANDNASDSSDDDFEDRPIESIILQEDCDADLERLLAEELDIAWIHEGSLPELRNQWGMELPIYVQFEETFPSAPKYRKEVIKVLVFHEAQADCAEADLITNITEYFKQSYMNSLEDAEEVEDGLPGLASTTLRSVLSMLCKFFRYTGRGDLKLQAPLIVDRLASWDKQHVTKKSHTLSRQNLCK
jgi:hypothetical protein